jgi:ribonuclease-3
MSEKLTEAQYCETRLGYSFKNLNLLTQALTHKSYHNEHSKKSPGHNERLEFLGDAVLDLSLSQELMFRFAEFTEGELSKARASLVNEVALSELATELGLDQYLLLGKGELQTGGAMKPRLLACAIEAMLGAVFLDSNFEAANSLILKIYKTRLENFDTETHFKADYKTRLQEKLQGELKQTPVYEVQKEEGPDHDKVFHVVLKIADRVVAQGAGRSKKQAEQVAAKVAWESL